MHPQDDTPTPLRSLAVVLLSTLLAACSPAITRPQSRSAVPRARPARNWPTNMN